MTRLAESQADRTETEAMRGHLRNLEIYMARLVEETGQGRAQSTNDIRNEIKILTRTIAAIAEEQPR
jgi:RNase P/RNase MRP subunit p30